ncbi:MAG: S8 family serine peptidase [Solirubrobacterales bacterium]
MPKGQGLRATAARLACLGALGTLLAVPASAMAAAGPPSGLSPRLAELAKPSVRADSQASQAEQLGLAPEGPGSLLREGNRVLAYVRFDHGAAASVDALRVAGGEVTSTSRRYQTVTVAIKPVDLTRVAATPGVAGVTEVLAPVAATSTCPAGAVVSEGVQQLNAGESPGEARDEFSVDGAGVTVGILSDSFNQATEAADGSGPIETTAIDDAKSGDLPGTGNTCSGQGTPVSVLEGTKPAFGEEPTDEGRAMAQIVHDLAPGANLDFASAFNGENSFAKNIEKLATAGAKVIADDVFYLEEPFFQDGPVAVAVDKVVGAGATYLSAAGNDNLFDSEGHEIASWEAPEYRDSGSCPAEVKALSGVNTTRCLDFNPGSQTDRTFGIKVAPGGDLTVDLQWDEPWNGVETDLDAYLLDANGRLIAESAENNIGNSQKPLEIVQWENESSSQRTVQLVVNRFSGSGARLKFGLLENGFGVAATEYPQSTDEDVVGPTIFGHSGTADAISVGAVPFDDSNEPERYSSRGPVRHDFGPVAGIKAAAPLGGPEIVAKPDVVATDCGRTTFFASFAGGGWHFCGTSAAAPHAAGVAALMLDDEPEATPDEIRAALQDGATAVGAFGPCAIGAGLLEAVKAIEVLPGPPPFTPSEKCATPEPEGSVEEAQASGDWGLETPPAFPPVVTQAPEPSKPSLVAPRTFIRSHPSRLIRTRARTVRVVFRFGSDEPDVTFACRIDGGLFRLCPERLARRFGTGIHTVRVVARDASGDGDRTPAAYRFRVKRIS